MQIASQTFQLSEIGQRALHSGVLVNAAFWAFKASSRSRKCPACSRMRSIAVVALAFDTHPNSWNVQVAFNQPSASPSNWISRWSRAGIAEACTPVKNSAEQQTINEIRIWQKKKGFVHNASGWPILSDSTHILNRKQISNNLKISQVQTINKLTKMWNYLNSCSPVLQ